MTESKRNTMALAYQADDEVMSAQERRAWDMAQLRLMAEDDADGQGDQPKAEEDVHE